MNGTEKETFTIAINSAIPVGGFFGVSLHCRYGNCWRMQSHAVMLLHGECQALPGPWWQTHLVEPSMILSMRSFARQPASASHLLITGTSA